MAMNFISCDRNQVFLMPPLPSEWLPDDHLVWTVLDAVSEMDLGEFYRAYRAGGHGRPAYEPSVMVALLLYAYARGNRSSRAIERACVEDVAYRVVAANLVPDHSTIADFRVRHEAALAELSRACSGSAGRRGWLSVGVIAIDGTKVAASASREANRSYAQIARAILAEAAETDRREDELYGEARGDELPEQLRTSAGRRAALRAAKAKLEREAGREAQPDSDTREGAGVEIELDPERFVTAARVGAPGFARRAAGWRGSASKRRARLRAPVSSGSDFPDSHPGLLLCHP